MKVDKMSTKIDNECDVSRKKSAQVGDADHLLRGCLLPALLLQLST